MTTLDAVIAWPGIGVALANHLWQSSVFAVAVWFITILLRRNAAQIRYRLWVVASLKFLVPISLVIGFGGLFAKAHVVSPHQQIFVYSALSGVSQPFSPFASSPALTGPSATHGSLPFLVRWLPDELGILWSAGASIVLLAWLLRWRRVYALLDQAIPFQAGRELEILCHLEERPNRPPEKLRFRCSPRLTEPCVFGVFRPVLLWPKRLSEQLSDQQLESILTHEIMHVRRHDNLMAAIHMAVETLFWFHPMVWWIEKQMIEERECACDEAAVDSGVSAHVYADGLLQVCRLCIESPLICASGVTGSELKRRIARIMAGETARRMNLWRKALLGLAAVAAVGTPLALGVVRTIKAPHAAAQAPLEKVGIVGQWQGTIRAEGRDLRVVLKIAKDGKGALSATLYSLDQSGAPMTGNSVSFEGGTLRFVNQLSGLTYQGRITTAGNSISGTVTQNGSLLPLVLERATPETEWAIPAPPTRIPAMAVDAKPGIEVATVKLSSPDLRKSGMTFRGREIVVYGYTLADLVKFCYDLQDKQLVNEPEWMSREKFDVSVLPDQPGFPDREQIQIVLKKLLSDRFALRFHGEQREMSVYLLTVARDGPRMTKSADPSELGGMSIGPLGLVRAHNMTMSQFSAKMQAMVLDRPVLDQTGLKGEWDFELKWLVDETQFGGQLKPPPLGDPGASLPSLFTAIQEQLGLKLEPEKATVPVMVIDHVERPTPN